MSLSSKVKQCKINKGLLRLRIPKSIIKESGCFDEDIKFNIKKNVIENVYFYEICPDLNGQLSIDSSGDIIVEEYFFESLNVELGDTIYFLISEQNNIIFSKIKSIKTFLKHNKEREWVVAEINKIYINGGSLRFSDMLQNNLELYSKGKSRFGTWKNAVYSSGVNCENITKWSKDKIISTIKEIYNKSNPNSVTELINSEDGNKVYRASQRYFGSFDEALEIAGLQQFKTNKKPSGYWNKNTVLSEIGDLKRKGTSLNHRTIKYENSSLVCAAKEYYGSWDNALKAVKIDPFTVKENFYSMAYFGRKFEQIVNNLLLELNVTYKKYKFHNVDKDIRPDYIFENGVWGDAKLSAWTIEGKADETLQKYLPHCKLLKVIYLRGDIREEKFLNKVIKISVFNLTKQLSKPKRVYYENILNTLLSEIKDKRFEIDEFEQYRTKNKEVMSYLNEKYSKKQLVSARKAALEQLKEKKKDIYYYEKLNQYI